jgi:TRAP-type C4-dicarboxylate transport system permease small subunit
MAAPGLLEPVGIPALLPRIETAVGLAISAALPLVLLLQMLDRFVFHGELQLGWTEEIARILMVWLTFWGAALVQRENSHIRLELVDSSLSAVARGRLHLAIDVLVVLFLVAMVVTGIEYAFHEWGMALPSTGLPRSIFVLAVVAGSVLMAVHIIGRHVARFRERPHDAEKVET